MSTAPKEVSKEVTEAVQEAMLATISSLRGGAFKSKVGKVADPSGKFVLANLTFEGDTQLAISLGITDKLADKLARLFTGCPIDFESEMMDDVAGEFLNVMAGDLDARLDRAGMEVQMSTPTTSREFAGSGLERIQQIDFDSSDGSCWIWISVPNE